VKTRIGMITIGQAPRVDVVPAMARLLGPEVEIVERGALDVHTREEIAALAPADGDQVLVTRLVDGTSVFVGKRHITSRVQRRIEEVEALGVAFTVLLCTGEFPALRAARPLLEPDKVVRGVLAGVSFPGRLGVLTPSVRHVEQTAVRWRAHGFDPVVAPLSPYDGHGDEGVEDAIAAFDRGRAGLVLMDCMGFQARTRDRIRAALGVPVVVANLLVARVAAELAGAA
jgi:protein AroM